MGDVKKAREFPFTFGCGPEVICEECQLPCQLEKMTVDCHRREFLKGILNCVYFVHGYCYLTEIPGCVMDNGGKHDSYWLQLLRDYFHNADNREEDDEFQRNRAEIMKLIDAELARQNVYLCRYIEQYYSMVLETGGGLSEDMLSRLDEVYLSLLRGISRKTD
ncbi:MAG TPA: hypothetical protein VLA34_15235 [Candidatus Krumholzibacterium sp.]|nr:hypothetical protein [Candidatus Krumholzibacterium sp.]